MAKELNPQKEDQKLLQAVRNELYSRLEDENTPAEVIVALTGLHAHLSTLKYEEDYCLCDRDGRVSRLGTCVCCNLPIRS
jgi:hypothetical protein